MGATIACAMELVDKGYLSEDEIGRSLKWGDAEAPSGVDPVDRHPRWIRR